MNSTTFTIVYVLAGIGTVAYLVLLHFLFERLADHHQSTWEALGSPRSFTGYTIGNFGRLVRFVWQRQFLALNDQAVSVLVFMIALLFVVLMGFILFQWFYAGGFNAPAV